MRHFVGVAEATAGVSPKVLNEISFLSTGLWMSVSGLGPSIMPSAYATCSPYRELVIKPLHQPKVSRDVYVVTKKGRSLSSACQTFLDDLRTSLQGFPTVPVASPDKPGETQRKK